MSSRCNSSLCEFTVYFLKFDFVNMTVEEKKNLYMRCNFAFVYAGRKNIVIYVTQIFFEKIIKYIDVANICDIQNLIIARYKTMCIYMRIIVHTGIISVTIFMAYIIMYVLLFFNLFNIVIAYNCFFYCTVY